MVPPKEFLVALVRGSTAKAARLPDGPGGRQARRRGHLIRLAVLTLTTVAAVAACSSPAAQPPKGEASAPTTTPRPAPTPKRQPAGSTPPAPATGSPASGPVTAPAKKNPVPNVVRTAVPAQVLQKVTDLAATSGTGVPVSVEVRDASGHPSFAQVVAADPEAARQMISALAAVPGITAGLDSTVHLTGTPVAVAAAAAQAGASDPLTSQMWQLTRLSQSSLATGGATGAGQVVAVLDTGVMTDHADLAGNVLAGYDFVAGTTTMTDPNGHGTFCAGEIAALAGNGVGGQGLAPGAKILPVRVLDAGGSGYSSTIAQGITWATDHGANVISMSLAGTYADSTEQSAVQYAEDHGVVVVAAAGNAYQSGNPAEYPASFPTVLAIAAVDNSDAQASFSEVQPTNALAAPGVAVVSTYNDGGYATMSGTSMATPLVAASVALVQAAYPGLNPAQVRDKLESTATDLGAPGRDDTFGYGLVDPARALGLLDAPASSVLAITSPRAALTVSGHVTLTADPSGVNGGITGPIDYQLSAGGTLRDLGSTSDSGSHYAVTWDSAGTPNGAAQIVATATEAPTGSTVHATVDITVGNLPPVDYVTTRWNALGGASGPLGPALGATYPVPGGEARDFAGGSIFWSSVTGAHFVRGAIRDEWAVGGWENGWLGYPTSDELCGLKNGGCVSYFQNGSIFWSPSTGAHMINVSLMVPWQQLGWEAGVLGYPLTNVGCGGTGSAYGCSAVFQGGTLNWSPATGGHVVRGAIGNLWGALGGSNSWLGYPTTDQLCGLKNGGCVSYFQTGAIFWSQTTGAHAVNAVLLGKWQALGWEAGVVGYPLGDVTCSGTGGSYGCTAPFQGGNLSWSPATGTQFTGGGIRALWTAIGGTSSWLGYPTTDETCGLRDGGCYSRFQAGSIYWSPTTPATLIAGPISDAWAAQGWENGPWGYPAGNPQAVPGGVAQLFQGGTATEDLTTGTVTFR